jgi:hypothetical protein
MHVNAKYTRAFLSPDPPCLSSVFLKAFCTLCFATLYGNLNLRYLRKLRADKMELEVTFMIDYFLAGLTESDQLLLSSCFYF